MDLLSLLLVLILILSLAQAHPSNLFAASVFAFATMTFDICSSYIPDSAYYLSAAMFDLAIIWCISLLITPTALTFELQKICGVSVIYNAVGWGAYMLYLSPMGYNVAYILLYVYVIIVLMRKGGLHHVGMGQHGGAIPPNHH